MNIVVAHWLEARPLVEALRLNLQSKVPYKIFSRGEIRLIVTGMGQEKCRRGILHLFEGATVSRWLNLGIAGHPYLSRGTLCAVNRVIYGDESLTVPCCQGEAHSLITVDTPETSYSQIALYDMEGYAFARSMCDLNIPDYAIYKIVSDNKKHPISQLRKGRVPQLISGVTGDLLKQLKLNS